MYFLHNTPTLLFGGIHIRCPLFYLVYMWTLRIFVIMEYSLDNIQEISISKDRIVLKYQDGTTNSMLVTEGVKFVRGFVSDIDSPIIDHCI
jgi:hypothetical protein